MNARQIGPLSGILFVALLVASFIVSGSTPSADDSAHRVVSFYTDNDTKETISAFLGALAVAAFLFFLATLRRALRAVAGDEGGLSTAVLVGGLMFAVGGALFSGLTLTLADSADDLPASATQAINALNNDLFIPVAVGLLVFNLALGLAVLRHGGLPRWLGWVAVIVAIASVTPAFFIAFIVMGIVIIVSSVVLMREAGASGPPPASGPQPGGTASPASPS